MIALRRGAVAALSIALLALCTACSGSTPPASSGGGTSAPTKTTSSSAPAAASVDVCALLPATELAAVAGAKPGAGTASKGKIDGGECTWTFSSTHTAIAQLTHKADQYLPASVYPKPKDASAVPGADRGWASASAHSIIVVKGSTGVLFNDIGFGVKNQGDQDAYDALAAAIVAKL